VLLATLREPGERDEHIPATLCVPVPRRWTQQAGRLPELLSAGVQSSKAAAQLVSQPLAWHLWKCWCCQKLCQPLVTSWEMEMRSQTDTDLQLPCFN